MASLVITSGQEVGNHYPLTNRTLTAGRDPARDIQLLDPKVSRKHFQIRRQDDNYVVFELRSRNGIFVNGAKTAEKVLKDGDQIQAGDTVLTFYEDDMPDRTDALQKRKRADRQAREDQTARE